MTSPIALIETAIVERLRSAPRSYTGLLVESYAGQLDDEMFSWIRTLPATWVTFGGAQEYKRTGLRSMKVRGTFEVLCAQRALVENAGRLNLPTTGADVGVYALVEDNKLALVNQQLGLAIQPLTPGPIRAVMKSMVNREAVVVYAQEFHTDWMEVFEQEAATPDGELQAVGMNYFLKPQHNAAVDPADKSDLITTT
jgi:phage gp37-like protein